MKNLLLAFIFMFVSEQVFSQTITLGSLLSSNYCLGSSISVPFTSTGFSAGTSYTVTLRKGTTVINTASSTTSPINIYIPYIQSAGYGTDYTMQVTSGSTSSLVSPNLTIGSLSNAEITDVNNHSIYTSYQDVICTGKTKIYYATVKDLWGTIVTNNINYQWKKDGVDIAGATSSSLSVSVSGTYTFVATQGSCSVTGYGVVLSVGTTSYSQVSVYGEDITCAGTTKTIESSYYSNTATYQWQKDGVNISGATNRAYNAATSGIHRVVVSDGTCNDISNERRLTFGSGLIASITANNGDTTLCSASGSSKYLFATSYSINPTQYTYQWQKDGVNISGATSNGYSASQAGVYTVTYSQGNCTSNSKGITIVSSTTAQKPVITAGNITSICSGSLTLNQNNNGVYSYLQGAWFKDGVVTTSTNSSQYTATASGTYKMINGYGTTCANESNAITVSIGTTLTPKITVPSYYANTNLCGTGDYKYLYFDNQNLSGGTYTLQWIKDGTNLSGSTNSSLFLNTVGTYTLRVTNGSCTAVSNAIVVSNNTPTTTILANDNNISCLNKMVRLDLQGGTTGYYTPIIWQRNGVTIAGETSGTLYTNQGGSYTATYNQNGCAGTSTALALNIVQPPLMSVSPVTINNGQTATLTATNCAGTVTWYDALNGGNLLTTGASYTSPPLPSSTTFYANCVESSCSSIKRTVGVVNVNQLQTITLDNPSPTNICPGSSFSLGFTTTGAFNGGNTFQVQLSDLNGNFTATPTVLATVSISPITVNLDANTPTSASYKIRVLATDPLTASSPSNFISINNTPTITSSGVVNCATITLQSPNYGGRTYQWQRDGVDISGATSVSYSTGTAGVYTLKSTVGTCVKTSSPIQIYSYNSSPSVSLAGSTTFCSGTSLVITANPNNPVSTYQWRKDGVNISGATSSTYAATLSGSYTVRVTQGSCPTFTSSSVYLSTVSGANSLDNYTSLFGGTDISPNYNVYSQPFNICSGSMILSTSQRSAGTTYQWQLDGVDISGETNATYSASQTGYYSVKISQGTCTGATTPVALRIGSLTPPSVGADVNICTGANHTIYAYNTTGQNCCGTGLSYQWIKDGVDIPSATNQYSYLANSTGLYSIRVSQGACTATSAPMKLTIGSTITSPSINSNLINEIACSSNTYQLNTYNNISSLTYQWIKDGVDIPSATSNFYNTSLTGKYQVKITQGTCTAISTEIQQIFGELVSPNSPFISGNSRICGGGTTSLSAFPSCDDYTYQWKRNGIAISGATAATYSTNIPAVYTVDITKGAKTITTSTLPVYEDCTSNTSSTTIYTPYVYSNSSDRMICSGSGKQLLYCDNYASQYPTVTYQWYKDGVQMAGQTSRFLFASDAGNYQVQLIVGANQSSLSSFYTLYNSGNNIFLNLSNGTTYGCTDVLLNSSIPTSTTKSPYNYQWKKDGVNLSGANQNFYNATLSGIYILEATLGTCAFTSSPVTVTIGSSNKTISSSPSNNLCDYGYVTLSPNLGNTFVYQWYKDNVLIPNINTRSYIATSAGSYSFSASQGACTYNSSAAVVVNPSFSNTPYSTIGWIGGYENSTNINLSACTGSNTTLMVNNYQQGKQFQWKNAGSAIAGANTATYQPSASGTYSADITTVGGCVVSSPTLTLSLGTTPSGFYINSNLVATNLCSGSSTTLNAGYGNFDTYQWYKDDVLIPNATSTLYNTNVAGSYNVKMTQGACAVETSYAVVQTSSTTITPRITSVSTSNDVSCNLTNGSLSTSSLNGGTYQWQRNGVNISGGTNYYYYPSQNGTYQVIVNQGTCSGTSNAVEIKNGVGLAINTDGLTGFICGESGGTLRATSNGGTYQWKKDGVNIGSNSTTLSVNAIGSYTVTNTRSGCTATSQPFEITSIPALESTKTGTWNNIGVWNCLRTPNSTDNVKVNFGHIVFLPNTSTYFIKSINDIGNVSFGIGSNLKIGF